MRHTTSKVRERIIDDYITGMSVREIMCKYCVSESTVRRILTKPDAYKPSEVESFKKEWDEARGRILGYRIGWAEEWNEARFKLLEEVKR